MTKHEISNSDFVHLHCHSEFSILDGAAHIKDMVNTVKDNGQIALGLTDHGNMHGAFSLFQECKKAGIKPIIGLEAYVTPGTSRDDQRKITWGKPGQEKDDVSARGSYTHMTLLSQNKQGLHNLMDMSTLSYTEGLFGKYPRIDRDLIQRYSKGIIATSGCPSGEIQTYLRLEMFESAYRSAGELQDIYGKDNFFIEIMDHQMKDTDIERRTLKDLIDISNKIGAKIIATNDSHYSTKENSILQDSILAINTGSTLDDPTRFKFDGDGYYLKTTQEMRELFKEIPQAITNTKLVAEMVDTSSMFEKTDLMPKIEVPEGYTQETYMTSKVNAGLKRIYGEEVPEKVLKQVDYELSVILPKGYASYFLVVQDFINWAKDNSIFIGPGRGSAAGAMVTYALGITDLDPLEYGLMFERFLNPERMEMPDIDVDMEQEKRGEVIQYIKDKYGEEYISQVVTFSKFKAKSALKDALRILAVDFTDSNKITAAYPRLIAGEAPSLEDIYDTENVRYSDSEEIRNIIDSDPRFTHAYNLALKLENFTRGTGVHASAVIMSSEKISSVLPIMLSKGQVVTQFENHDCEDLGMVKMDFLGLKTLDVLHMTLDNIESEHGVKIDINKIPLNDKKTFELLAKGDTIGCFQLEAGYIKSLLRQMKPDKLADIIALNALNRPGPLAMGTHEKYAMRKTGKEEIVPIDTALDDKIGPILEETYGLIVYQEQVQQIAMVLSSFTAGESDGLRKAMGKKNKVVLKENEIKFKEGAVKNGYSQSSINKLWDIMEPFGKYAFNKAHSACYGMISYQTAYLKAHYPVEFLANLLNTEFRGNKDNFRLYLEECRRQNIKVACPSINNSLAKNTSNNGEILLGFLAIANVGENIAEPIIKTRDEKGLFTSFDDFMKKVPSSVLNKRVIESLIKAGAFDEFENSRASLLAISEDYIDSIIKIKHKEENENQVSLFASINEDETKLLGITIPDMKEWEEEIKLNFEKEVLGLFVSGHPLEKFEQLFSDNRTHSTSELNQIANDESLWENKIEVVVCGQINNVFRGVSKKGRPYGTFMIGDLGGDFKVACFGPNYQKYQNQIQPSTLVKINASFNPSKSNDSISLNSIEVLNTNGSNNKKDEYEKLFESSSNTQDFRLKLDSSKVTKTNLEQLNKILDKYKGNKQVYIDISGTVLLLDKCVNVDNNFKQEIDNFVNSL